MAGRALPPTSPYAGDDGSADPRLVAGLSAHEPGTRAGAELVAALAGARLLVPVLAELEASGTTSAGLHVDKEASAGVVALRTPDGRTALPVFSGVDAMRAWRADARPLPASAPRAAAACLAEGWD
ncbi:SseB family protein, partial [Actinotalea ferrariae]|uniref:SseB family protein n=1 Tax=Actinotalea ferrariae TaxID=1386098 RepID=UPI001C8B4D3E